MKTKTFNNEFLTNRSFDNNGFMFVKNNLILSDGVMEYYGSELGDYVDGEKLEPDKLYKLNISKEELEKSKDKWRMIPIRDGHDWTTTDNVKGEQIGTIGENIELKEIDGVNYLMCNLSFNDKQAIDEITSNEKYELSTSYENDLKKSDNPDYDFEVINILPNHLALVEKGRAGDKVRVANENTIGDNSCFTNNINNKTDKKMENEIKLSIDGKEVDLSKFIKEEQAEGEHDESITDNSDELDNACKNEDKRAIIDEIGGMLKDKVDEELWRTIIGKLEKLSYEPSEDETKIDNEEKEEDKEEDEEKKENENKTFNSVMFNSLLEKAKKELELGLKNKQKAYNSVRNKVGDFDYSEMDEAGIYKYALQNSGIELAGNESLEALKLAFNVYNSQNRVVNFNSKSENKDFIPSHIK